MTRIAPSLLAADYACLRDEVAAVEAAGSDWLHLDVMDGHFVPNISFGPALIKALRPHTGLPFDVHLMIEPAEPFLAAFAEAGATRISVHVEATRHLDRALQQIADLGCHAGVAINPATPASAIAPILHRIDLVIAMTVNPGFGGQTYLPNATQKIAALREVIGDHPVAIEADGGITQATAGEAARAGASVLVAGSAIFGADDYGAAIAALRDAADR